MPSVRQKSSEHWPWIRKNKSVVNYVIKFTYRTATVVCVLACERRGFQQQSTRKILFFQLPLIYFDVGAVTLSVQEEIIFIERKRHIFSVNMIRRLLLSRSRSLRNRNDTACVKIRLWEMRRRRNKPRDELWALNGGNGLSGCWVGSVRFDSSWCSSAEELEKPLVLVVKHSYVR